MKNKKEIREDIKTIFNNISYDEQGTKSEKITQDIVHYFNINNFKRVCVYEHIQNEVNTDMIISSLQDMGIQIYTPQMIGETEMILIDNDFEHYEKEIDVFIIPGRAFTKDGKRLGRGKGYYDRLLAKKIYKKSRKIGICYDFQILNDLPVQKHDIMMNKVITND